MTSPSSSGRGHRTFTAGIAGSNPAGDTRARLTIVPVTFAEANEFVRQHHRHHRPVPGCKFVLAVSDGERIRGVAIVGRPVARHYDDGWTLEVNRTATDGTPNANSALYAAASRVSFGLGYLRLITYTMAGESGASLRGAGWRILAERAARPGWHRPARPRVNRNDNVQKLLWTAPSSVPNPPDSNVTARKSPNSTKY